MTGTIKPRTFSELLDQKYGKRGEEKRGFLKSH